MDNELLLALFITAVGMTLLFLSLALFYGLLTLMTRLFEDRPAEAGGQAPGGLFFRLRRPQAQPAAETPAAATAARSPDRLRAAVAAVAIARAEAEEVERARPQPGEDAARRETSAWWALHHQRRMDSHADTRRAR